MKKIIICILAFVIMLLIGGIAFYYTEVQKQRKEQLQKEAEKKALEQKNDSIYKCFETPDLKMAEVKGFVHTLDYIESVEFDYGSCRSLLSISLVFDKKGNIVDIKSQSGAYYFDAGDDDRGLLTASFERNHKGQIDKISVRSSYTNGGGDSYPIHLIRKIKYSSDGHISKITSEGGYAHPGVIVDETIRISDYVEGKGTTKIMVDWYNGYVDGNEKETGLITDVQCDEKGNWVSRRGKYRVDGQDLEGNSTTTNGKIKQSRVITYYNKDEIDFSSICM